MSARQHLLLAARQCASHLCAAIIENREAVEELSHVGLDLARIAAQVAAHLQILDHRHVRKDASSFRTMGDAELQNAARGGASDILALEDKPARSGRDKPGDRLQRCRFAGAVGADQRDEFASMNFQRQVADRRDLAITAGEPLNREHERAFRQDKRE
jgi:hypothetical protein